VPRVLVNLLFITGTKGGGETYIRELYRALGAMDTEFEFVGYASRELMSLDHSWFPGDVVDSRISGENRFTWAFGEFFGVARAARRLKADLIHGPTLFGPPRSHVPAVVSIHDLLYFSNPEMMSKPLYTEPVKWMEKRGARNASRVITISEVSAAAIHHYLGVPKSKIDLIPLAGTPPMTGAAQIGGREPDLFLAIGTRRPHRNHALIVEALRWIDPGRRPRVVITGGHDPDPLVPLVEKHGLQDWVDLRSWVAQDELDSLYARATAFIDASFAAGFGLPALEAMLAGLPVLLADTPIFREVAGDAVRYFDPHDAQSLARLMTEMTADPVALDRMAVAGLAHARRFSWENVAEETLTTFRRALFGR
jgi:alpha-1,3-rhamnosyl/mannosyltransferase